MAEKLCRRESRSNLPLVTSPATNVPHLAVYGTLEEIPAYIRIDSNVERSQVSLEFCLAHNLPCTDGTLSGVTSPTSHGPVEVPTTNGFYTSTFEITVRPSSEAFNVILGQDWISACSPEFSPDGEVADPTQPVIDSLPEGHEWDVISEPDSNSCCDASENSILGTRHERFYFEDGNTIIQMEQTLYSIHRHFLQSYSEVFETMFSLTPESHMEGLCDEDPIYLPQTQCKDFDRFLSLFYPKDVMKGDLHTTEEWTSVLEISSRWGFEAHRKLALEKLHGLVLPFERLLLARRYGIGKWLAPAILGLCVREQSLSLDEGKLLDLSDVIGIADLRDTRVRRKLSMKSMQDLIERKVKLNLP